MRPCWWFFSDSDANCRQPASLPCRRNTRINDRHLNNVPGALKLTRQSRLRGSSQCRRSFDEVTKPFPAAATTWANRIL
ncbi:hypothetical protein ALC60_12608 [Trachymyrmex zeteki]|uniref:Uncharacterized protein n=1 Tax=Mycetomoellerius zeteki TaxID=64791 RepID=A0A151WKE0_9HYME|nr:hypothetical protein ALC60_12608 [Trachymyrmex zeteki]